MILNEQTKVVFREAEHTYTMGDKQLSGVTTMLAKMLFADKYADVPEAVLQRAAAYGSGVHKQIELAINEGIITDSAELRNSGRLLAGAGITPDRAEYLVSDERAIASSIDIVGVRDGGVVLVDTKTTSGGLDRDYLSWQLSVYAYLFELQNPHLKVAELYGLWLRHEDSDLQQINRKSNEDVEQLIADYVMGVPTTLQARETPELPAPVIDLAELIRTKIAEQKLIDAEVAGMKATLMELMREHQVTKFTLADKLSVAYIAPTERESLDTKKLQENHPDICAMYTKKSKVKENLKITLK